MSDIRKSLAKQYPECPTLQTHFADLLTGYLKSGLAGPNLGKEIETGDEQKLWACIWEAMLYRHFSERDFEFRRDHVCPSGQNGPDIGLIHGNRTIWIEAVVPKPEGIPSERLAPPAPEEMRAIPIPRQAMLLRWTSALRDKNHQLKRRLQKNIVKPDDPYVVAINSCMLSWVPIEDHSITQLPFAVGAVFPIGPLAVPLTKEGRIAGDAIYTHRGSIKKPAGAHVPTDNFLNSEYSGISALIGCSRRDMLDGQLHLIVVHNPLARNRLSTGLMGAETYYVAQKDGADSYLLTSVKPQ